MSSILIVNNDQSTANTLQHELQAAGYHTIHANSLKQGLVHVREDAPDLVLLDLTLPDGSGRDFLARLRGSTIPVVILTACDDAHVKVELLNLGASDYVTKPYQPKELLARIAVQLRVPHFDIVTIRDIQLSSKARVVTYLGHELHFSPTEFDILEFFMRHPERIYTSTMVYQAVWGTGMAPTSNVVETHVTRIRQKLRAVGVHGLIRNVHRLGYALYS
ncbi:response regulator transcription factor (plasmid) [Deinococcus radiomollis]|uniref:response regulator transcription factor n=1 Tax=Deinococcus radiomollis TaxID=468916 RepID=UPI0038927F40